MRKLRGASSTLAASGCRCRPLPGQRIGFPTGTVADMPAPARALLTAASLLRHLVMASICTAAFLLCRRVLQYRPLAKSSTNALGAGGGRRPSRSGVPQHFRITGHAHFRSVPGAAGARRNRQPGSGGRPGAAHRLCPPRLGHAPAGDRDGAADGRTGAIGRNAADGDAAARSRTRRLPPVVPVPGWLWAPLGPGWC